jgi:hypothetical protein
MSYIKTASIKKPQFIQFSFVVLLILLCISAIYFKVIHPNDKIKVLLSLFTVAALFFVYKVFRKKDWSLYSLGFRSDNLKTSYGYYLIAATVGSIALYAYSYIYGLKHGGSIETYFNYSFLGSGAQEFLFRVVIWKLTKELFGEEGIVSDVVNILFFSGMHIIYDSFWINYLWLLIVFGGILFTALYREKTRNFYLITATHIELNSFAVYLGIFH